MRSKILPAKCLDPTIRTTPEEAALVIEQGFNYLDAIAEKKRRLYETRATIDEIIEVQALKGISYGTVGGGGTKDKLFQILSSSEYQMKQYMESFGQELYLISQEEEKFFCIHRAYLNLPMNEYRLLELFYNKKMDRQEIINTLFQGVITDRTLYRKKNKCLKKIADKCIYTPPDSIMTEKGAALEIFGASLQGII